MEYPREWEKVNDSTYRLKVFQGWLVMSTWLNDMPSSWFVFDVGNNWILEPK
jgi:hypothetical protein